MDRRPEEGLPSAQRPDDAVQGHWLLARLGKRVLRPGGIELTRTLLSRADVADADVLEIALGPLVTSCGNMGPDTATSGSPTPLIPDCPTPPPMSSLARRC
jgi:hypothetical protein